MLVTFKTKAFANITMFGDVAIKLLKLMGHSGTVPSAMEPEDIPAALKRLRRAVAAGEGGPAEENNKDRADDGEKESVSLRNRALPLIQLLEAAQAQGVPVMWDG